MPKKSTVHVRDFFKNVFLPALFLCGLPAAAGAARTEFRDRSWGARPLALGGAYIGVPGDGYSAFSNPAGLAQLETDQATVSYGKPLAQDGLKGGALGALSYADASDNSLGKFGFWWTHASVPESNEENTVGLGLGRYIYRAPADPNYS